MLTDVLSEIKRKNTYGARFLSRAVFFILLGVVLVSCSKEYTPKPIGYNRIERRDSIYKKLETKHFSFLYFNMAHVDTIHSPNRNDVWFDIVYLPYNARIHCSYFPVTKETFNQAAEDSYHLAYNHAVKANGINQLRFENTRHRTSGIVYDINGDVATPVQFFITDSLSHFFRASLYYDTQMKADSVQPVTQYVRDDIMRLIDSFEWK